MMNKRRELIELIHKSGAIEGSYIKISRLLRDPNAYSLILNHILDEVSNLGFNKVGGIEYGGIPWASMLAYKLSKGLFYVKRLLRGEEEVVVGQLYPGEGVIIIDDVISRGDFTLNILSRLKTNYGIKIIKVIFILDREEGGLEKLKSKGFNAVALINLSDLNV